MFREVYSWLSTATGHIASTHDILHCPFTILCSYSAYIANCGLLYFKSPTTQLKDVINPHHIIPLCDNILYNYVTMLKYMNFIIASYHYIPFCYNYIRFCLQCTTLEIILNTFICNYRSCIACYVVFYYFSTSWWRQES